MAWKILSLFFLVLLIGILGVYWFVPLSFTEFYPTGGNTNFSLNSSLDSNIIGMQFYENMRFPEKQISYRIYGCPIKKEDDLISAFNFMSGLTILNFYSVDGGEEISVTCQDSERIEGTLFIAGEGGPINITQTKLYNVIHNGKILLLRESDCPLPNIAIHELLHVLGFKHSDNKNNILYPVSSCKQEIGGDLLNVIDSLYSIPGKPDLHFENVSASMNGKYLNTEIEVRNSGLKDSTFSGLEIYADDKLVKEFDIEPIEVGAGIKISLENVWVSQISVEKVKFVLVYLGEELDKENNEIVLGLKSV